MAFTDIEADVVNSFNARRDIGAEWNGSALRDVVLSAPSTKARFARQLVSRLAAEAGVKVGSIPARVGNRRKLGAAICEIKFSTEDPARFQQVRPPENDYHYLLGIGAHPRDFVYWLVPAQDVQHLIDEGDIQYQHADTSLWFRPETIEEDIFSTWRMNAGALVAALSELGAG